MVKKSMDEVTYQYENGQNILILRKENRKITRNTVYEHEGSRTCGNGNMGAFFCMAALLGLLSGGELKKNRIRPWGIFC